MKVYLEQHHFLFLSAGWEDWSMAAVSSLGGKAERSVPSGPDHSSIHSPALLPLDCLSDISSILLDRNTHCPQIGQTSTQHSSSSPIISFYSIDFWVSPIRVGTKVEGKGSSCLQEDVIPKVNQNVNTCACSQDLGTVLPTWQAGTHLVFKYSILIHSI